MDKTEKERKKERFYTVAKNYMSAAHCIAERSYCNRLKVGCLFVKNGNIISFGFNGTIRGFENVCETADGISSPTVVHAEMNAICKLANSSETAEGSTVFITHSPCIECAKLLIQCRVKEVIYDEKYRDSKGIEILKQSGINVIRLLTLKPKVVYD